MLTSALLRCTVAILDDACPFDPRFYRCGLCEDDPDDDCCAECWRSYLVWLTQASDPYSANRPCPLPERAAANRLQTALVTPQQNFLSLAAQGFPAAQCPHHG